VVLGRWQQVLVDALVEQPAIGVRATVQQHLRRPLTRAESIAARRAANRLGDLAQVVHLQGVPTNQDRLVLVRPGVHLEPAALARAARGLPPRPVAHGPGGTKKARSALTLAQRAAQAADQVDADRLKVDTADALSVELDDAIESLVRLSREMRRRASSDAWMTTSDRRWQERWADVVDYHDRTGHWPVSTSADADQRAQAHWLARQRRRHRDHQLSPEREAIMRAAGFRFTAYRRTKEG
jgi:hypothetical protein